MSKQVIEPYTFQCKTNIEEHNDIVNKVNEIVDVVNGLDVEEITKDISALESEVSAQGNEIDAINTEIAGLPTKTEVANGDVTAVAVDKTTQGIEIQLTRPAGVLEDSVALPFINTATLIPTSTERAFKIRFTYTDGTQYDTNEFVIPEGGGTDVSVTGVTVEDGTAPNSFKVAIQLSDASTIASNDYEIDIPAQQNTYPTSVSGTLSGSTLTLTIGLNNSTNVQGTVDLSAFLTKSEASTTYATKAEVNAIGVTSEGNNVTVNGSNATIVKSVSGQVTDGNLKITVNGITSGDIPLPESGLTIGNAITLGANTIISWGAELESITNIQCGTQVKNDNVVRYIVASMNIDQYSCGDLGKILVHKIKATGSNNTYLSKKQLYTFDTYPIMNDVEIKLTGDLPSQYRISLPEGTYRHPICGLNFGGKAVDLLADYINDAPYIEFSVNSNEILSLTPQTIILDKEKYVTSQNGGEIDLTGLVNLAMKFIVDLITKVN